MSNLIILLQFSTSPLIFFFKYCCSLLLFPSLSWFLITFFSLPLQSFLSLVFLCSVFPFYSNILLFYFLLCYAHNDYISLKPLSLSLAGWRKHHRFMQTSGHICMRDSAMTVGVGRFLMCYIPTLVSTSSYKNYSFKSGWKLFPFLLLNYSLFEF